MAIGDAIKEAWFVGVVAGAGALILILIIVIIILLCLWCRRESWSNSGKRSAGTQRKSYSRKKQDEKREGKHHDIERDSSNSPSSYQEMTEAQNWTLVQQNGINSVAASTDTPRHISGDEPFIAGSSMIKMNKEMRQNGVQPSQNQANTRTETYTETHTQTHSKTGIEKTLEQNHNVDAFERKRSDASEVSRGAWRGAATSSTGFERTSEVRESLRSNQSYQKPRIANIQVSQSKKYESHERARGLKDRGVNLPERANSMRTTQTTVYNQSSQAYRIPEEDYSNSGIVMYSEEEKTSWRDAAPPRWDPELHRLSDGKVKNLAEKFETTETSTSSQIVASPSRNAVEIERRESMGERRFKKRKSDSSDYHEPMSPRQVDYQSYLEHTGFAGSGGHFSTNWQGKSGKGTIETRVNRIKKVGAVAVFPD